MRFDSPILGGWSDHQMTWLDLADHIAVVQGWVVHARIGMEQNDLKRLIELHDPFLLHCQCRLPNTNFGLITKI